MKMQFLNREFYIDETVHTPRSSTEEITKSGYIPYLNQLTLNKLVVADIGIGSGVMASSCVLECPSISKMFGVDLYDAPLKISTKNIENLHLNKKIILVKGDLMAPLLDTPIHVLLVNLPFASTAKVESILDKTTEPMTGIHGGETGFEIYEKLFKQLGSYRFMDNIVGIWIFCGLEHLEKIKKYHQNQFFDFQLMPFKDKFKAHFINCLLTKRDFLPDNHLERLC